MWGSVSRRGLAVGAPPLCCHPQQQRRISPCPLFPFGCCQFLVTGRSSLLLECAARWRGSTPAPRVVPIGSPSPRCPLRCHPEPCEGSRPCRSSARQMPRFLDQNDIHLLSFQQLIIENEITHLFSPTHPGHFFCLFVFSNSSRGLFIFNIFWQCSVLPRILLP